MTRTTLGLLFASCGCWLSGCGGSDPAEEKRAESAPTCETLFGLPNENSGLTQEQCMPRCADCKEQGAFDVPEYSSALVADLREWVLLNRPELQEEDPYAHPEDFVEDLSSVCGIELGSTGEYRLETYASEEDAAEAGARVTHHGACGACSSLRDLAVYIEIPDLTEPVRQCGLTHLTGDVEDLAGCIAGLGFSEACSQIWAFNSLHTREHCFDECISALNDPYHLEDGSPNACIQCDEERSGPVFKAVSGRTRRNSGLPTALCRPCDGVAPIDHHYATVD